jgi:ABC-2 type transport system ATP-binding protein
MVVQEYLQMIAELREIPAADQLRLIGDAIRSTGLVEQMVRPIGELSKGLRQRVGLAQAILHKPKVLILDEPTSGLDPTQIAEIRRLIGKLAKQATVLLSTHILSEVELTCERVLIIDQGEVKTDAQIADLKAGNTALVSVDQPETEARKGIQTLGGATDIRLLADDASEAPSGFHRYRITSDNEGLCPELFDLAKSRGWRLAELRQDHNTLESVFNRVVRGGGAA